MVIRPRRNRPTPIEEKKPEVKEEPKVKIIETPIVIPVVVPEETLPQEEEE